MNLKKYFLIGFLAKISFTIGLFLLSFHPIQANNVSVQLLPAAPENAAVVHNSPTEVELTWDASPSNPGFIDSYTVFYKLKTDPNYPPTPQITKSATSSSYSETITVLPNTGYDFIIFANSVTGLASTEDCTSCKATNAICGNGLIDVGEVCDSGDLQGAVCTDFSPYTGGILTCSTSCAYNFSSCTSPSPPSGGGPVIIVDDFKPTVGKVTSPPYALGPPIVIHYEDAQDIGGSGLDSVSLYYKKGSNSWQEAGLTSMGESGSFNFNPPDNSNGTYYFFVQAKDKEGNVSAYPEGDGQTSTIFDTTKPTIESIVIPGQATGPITITYQNAIDPIVSGLKHVELWYKKTKTGLWVNTLLTNVNASGSFIFNDFEDSNEYYFDLIVIDKAGNTSAETSEAQIPVIFDNQPPIFASLTAGEISNNNLLAINYQGAQDVGLAGLKQVQLWYKKEKLGTWTATSFSSNKVADSFDFPLQDEGTYYFALTLEDNFGNKTQAPGGDGNLVVVFGEESFNVVLTNLPEPVTSINNTGIGVTGENLVSYKYKINDGPYSEEIPIDTLINLQNLEEGEYTLTVIAKNSQGEWQDPSEATTYTWIVQAPLPEEPVLQITGPFFPNNTTQTVSYELHYLNVEEITLKSEDLTLNTTGSATGVLTLQQKDENTWIVIISQIQGEGELSFTVAANTATTSDNKILGSVTSPIFIVTEEDLFNPPKYVELFTGGTPEIVPPAPAIDYSDLEIQQVAVDAIQKITEVSGISSLSLRPEISADRLEACRQEYPSVNFDQRSLDSDGDGLSNRTECYFHTHPLLPDTDEDECSDGDEVNWLQTNPLEAVDCPFAKGNKAVRITTPQNDWLISRLEIMGLTPDDTSTISLFAFPVEGEKSLVNQAVMLGKIKQFNPSTIGNHIVFELDPNIILKEGQTYDLMAVAVLLGGQTLSSPPVRFTFDSSAGVNAPKPLTIGEVSIPKNLKLTNVHIGKTEDGRIRVTGESEYGAQVFAIWQSVVLNSSIITDSELGSFSIESPQPLELDEPHKVTLYAIKYDEDQMRRSENVEVYFYLHPFAWIYYLFVIILLKILVLIMIYWLRKNELKLTNSKN